MCDFPEGRSVASGQHVAQTVKGWPNAAAGDRQMGVRLAETIARVRWRLWHGHAQRALDLIGHTLMMLDATAETAPLIAATAGKLARALHDLETYVSGQSEMIIDYATARRCDEPISTAIMESMVQWLLHRRMGAQQQMR